MDSNIEPLTEDVDGGIIGQFEVVDACHYAGKIIIRHIRRVAWAADDGEHWS